MNERLRADFVTANMPSAVAAVCACGGCYVACTRVTGAAVSRSAVAATAEADARPSRDCCAAAVACVDAEAAGVVTGWVDAGERRGVGVGGGCSTWSGSEQ